MTRERGPTAGDRHRSADLRGLGLLVSALRPDRSGFAVATAWLVLAGALDAVGPLLGKYFIDGQLVPRTFDAAQTVLLLGGMLVLGWSAALLRYFTLIRMAGIAMRSVQRLRQWVHAHVLQLPLAWFDRAITGQVVSRITNDTEQIRQLYVQVLFEVLQGLTVLAAAVAAMAWLDWRLMLLMLVLLPVMTAIIWLYRRLSAAAVARTRELRSEINAAVAEGIAGMSLLQATGSVPRHAQAFAGLNAAYHGSRLRELRANAFLLRPALDLVNLLLVAASIAAFGTWRVDGGQVGLLYAAIAYIGRTVEPLIQITQQFSMLQQALVSSARLQQLLTEPAAAPATGEASPRNGGIRIHRLTFGYAPGEPVLHDLDLQIVPGSLVGIVGHTGAGKSTLFSLLLRFYAPWSGRIELGGASLDGLSESAFRAAVGVVAQEPFLLAATVAQNIDMARSLSPERITQAARAAGAHGFISALEHGYDTLLGEGGARLSAGQKQLLAIARALAGEPRILLLDEATARVDSATEQALSDSLARLRGHTTVVAIAHRLSTIRNADRIIVLAHGRVAETGTHDELMQRSDGIYRRLYRLQMSPLNGSI